jgi:type I restriction enzyme S subunit
VKFISEKDHEEISRRSLVEKGDVLFAMIGTIGNPVVVRGEPHFSIKNVALFKYYSQRDCSADYLRYSLHHFSTEMADRAAGGLQPFVSLKFLRDFCLPLPPLAEQHRIVAKVDELMLLCDELKARLSTTATTRRQLLEATLHDALNDKARITG